MFFNFISGLDSSAYRHAIIRDDDEETNYKQISQFCLTEEERFKNCERFVHSLSNS